MRDIETIQGQLTQAVAEREALDTQRPAVEAVKDAAIRELALSALNDKVSEADAAIKKLTAEETAAKEHEAVQVLIDQELVDLSAELEAKFAILLQDHPTIGGVQISVRKVDGGSPVISRGIIGKMGGSKSNGNGGTRGTKVLVDGKEYSSAYGAMHEILGENVTASSKEKALEKLVAAGHTAEFIEAK